MTAASKSNSRATSSFAIIGCTTNETGQTTPNLLGFVLSRDVSTSHFLPNDHLCLDRGPHSNIRPDSLSLITISTFGWPSTLLAHYDSCVQMFSGDPVTMADSLHNEWASDTYLIRVEGPFGIPINLDGTFRYEDKFQYLPIHPIDRHSPVVYFIGHDPTVTVELDTIECDLYE